VGRNISNIDPNVFSISCNNLGNCLSIDTNRAITIPGVLDVKAPAYIKELTIEQTLHCAALDITSTTTFNQTVEVNGMFTVKNTSSWCNIRCVPSVNGAESAIAFFNKYNQQVITTGDAWMIGRNLFNANTDMFQLQRIM